MCSSVGLPRATVPWGKAQNLGLEGLGSVFSLQFPTPPGWATVGTSWGLDLSVPVMGVVVLNTGVNEVASKKAICNLGSARHLLVTQPRGRGRVLAIVVYSAWFLTRVVKNSGTITDEISEMKILCRG